MTQLAVAAVFQQNVIILTTVYEYEGFSLNNNKVDSSPVVKKKKKKGNINELVNPNKPASSTLIITFVTETIVLEVLPQDDCSF